MTPSYTSPADPPVDMGADRRLLVRSVLAISACIALMLALESAVSVLTAPVRVGHLFSFRPDEARAFVNTLGGSFNQLLAVVFTTVAIAVPLTANMYSVKFLELFITDRVNLVVLLLFVFGIPNNAWLQHTLKGDFFPTFQVYLTLGMAVVYPSLLVPYLYYIFRFLHPATLLRRLSAEFAQGARRAREHPDEAARRGAAALVLLEHVASVGVRSVERGDRATAVESVLALGGVLRGYWRHKASLPAAWHVASPGAFRSFPPQEVSEIAAGRTTVEMKVLSELREVLSAASPRMHDVVSAVADTTRSLGLDEAARSDVRLEEMVVEHFNTFIRLTINRRDVRSVFILFHHYRAYAEGIAMERPERVQEIAYYFQYYAQAARDAGMPFVVETIAHDLGDLVRSAWEKGYANRSKLLERFLLLDRAGSPPLAGVKKAQAILAGYFLMRGLDDQAALVRESFRGLPGTLLASMQDDLLHVRRERFWEVNDRRVNMDYVPDEQRAYVARLFAALAEDGAAAPAAAGMTG
jgi:hypothetical protein